MIIRHQLKLNSASHWKLKNIAYLPTMLIFIFSLFISIYLSALTTSEIKPDLLLKVEWNYFSNPFQTNFVYTPFFIEHDQVIFFTAGAGSEPGNGVLKYTYHLQSGQLVSQKKVVTNGPDLKHYNYFRAVRVAKYKNELWMIAEISGCYTGCNNSAYPNSLGVFRSNNNGESWSFLDYLKIDGKRYIANWFAHTGLIYNSTGDNSINLIDLTKNKFITVGENKDMLVSADGVNYKSVAIKHPYAKDRLVFASLIKTPYGYHLTTCANWSDTYYTTTVRHLFSKDLINWFPIEPNSYLKNRFFYKGVHLNYDETTNKIWAYSPCGVISNNPTTGCNILAWIEAKDYLKEEPQNIYKNTVPVGEYVLIGTQSAMVTARYLSESENKFKYKVLFSNGATDSGYTFEMFKFPLLNYNRLGCTKELSNSVCVGYTVEYAHQYASILGIYKATDGKIKYALRFNNGYVDTGFTHDDLKFF